MFSRQEKQLIAMVLEKIIKELNHPEIDNENIQFELLVRGRESWSFAEIHPNSKTPGLLNAWNEISRGVLNNEPNKEE